MLIHIGIGDGYGRAFEFNDPEFVKLNNVGVAYALREDEDPRLYGTYTDDTQMSMALAECVIKDQRWTRESVALRFVEAFERDPHGGYSKRIRAALEAASKLTGKRRVDKFLDMCSCENVINSNGTVMRSVPIGVLPSEGRVVNAAQVQASVTHSSAEATYCSQLIALASHYFYYRKHKVLEVEDFVSYMLEHGMCELLGLCLDSYKAHLGPIPCDAKITTGAVLYGLWRFNCASDMLKWAVSLQGDVDSVASIMLGLASLKDDVIMDLPIQLYTHMELLNADYGRHYLETLDVELLKRFPRPLPKLTI